MRSSIILSGLRDPDLIALYKTVGSLEFSNMIKDALRMITRGRGKITRVPNTILLHGESSKETIKVNLIITAQQDGDIRELLSHILPGKISAFVKQALRFYVGSATVLSGFLNEEYSGLLQANPTPIQVFAIGNCSEVTQVTKKKSRNTTKRRIQKPKTNAPLPESEEKQSNSVPFEVPVFASSERFSEKQEISEYQSVCTKQPSENNTTASEEIGNSEDEVLAMLEGLLG